jgi:hypothetical protein
MKTFEDALSALNGLEGGSELVEAVKSHVGKSNNEAKNLRDRLKTTSDRLKKVSDFVGVDPELDDIDGALEDAKKKIPNPDKYENEIKKVRADLDKVLKERDDERSKRQKSEVNSALTQLLTENKVLPTVSKGLNDVLSMRVKISEDGKPVYVADDGSEIAVADGVKAYLAANPGFVSNDQKGGAGGKGGDGGSGAKSMQRSEFDALSPKARAEFATTGGEVKD